MHVESYRDVILGRAVVDVATAVEMVSVEFGSFIVDFFRLSNSKVPK